MKKIIFSFLIVLFSISLVSAQVLEGTSNVGNGPNMGIAMFGVKAGFGFSTFTGRDYIDITPKLGYSAGGLVEIPAFFENFYLQPEVIVQLQGADVGTGDLNLLYIHVPLMVKYHITNEIAVEFGPQIGFLLADNWDEDLSVIDTEKLQFGLNAGGGYRMNDNLYFQLRIGQGLTRVIESTTTKNFSLQAGACYFF